MRTKPGVSAASCEEYQPMNKTEILIDEPAGDCPQMIFRFKRKLAMEHIVRIKQIFADAIDQRKPLIFEEDVDIFQLINGEWKALSSDPVDPPETKPPTKFREFL